jgi:hypothetical protein
VSASRHVGDVQAFVRPGVHRDQRAHRGVVLPGGRHRDQLAGRPAQRGQLPAEDAAGVQADGVVDPLRLRGRGVAVDDRRRTAVVTRPRIADRQAVLVGLAGRLAVEREAAHPAGGPALVGLLEPGVRDHEPAAVEHVVADQALDERFHLGDELRRLGVELGERLRQAVSELDVAPVELAGQLLLVVARHADRRSGRDHAHHQAQHAGRVGTPVDQVADEDRDAALGMRAADRPARRVAVQGVAQLHEQCLQLGAAAVHVADDVERAAFRAAIVEQLLVADPGGRDLFGTAQHMHLAEALPGQLAQRAPQVAMHPGDHLPPERAVRSRFGAFPGHGLRYVEDDRHRQDVVLARDLDQSGPGVRLQVGGVHDGQPAGGQALAGHVVQYVESVAGRRLVVLVVGDQAPEVVRGEHLGRPEMGPGEGRLAGSGDADEHDESEFRNVDHAVTSVFRTVKRASWVGEPVVASQSPTARKSTW